MRFGRAEANGRKERASVNVTALVAWLALLIGVYNALGGYWDRERARRDQYAAELNYYASLNNKECLDRLGVPVKPYYGDNGKEKKE